MHFNDISSLNIRVRVHLKVISTCNRHVLMMYTYNSHLRMNNIYVEQLNYCRFPCAFVWKEKCASLWKSLSYLIFF